tara:strand:- start:3042 stop:3377 length:336 start_codon:yes stop_codon:yes gene_type:complete
VVGMASFGFGMIGGGILGGSLGFASGCYVTYKCYEENKNDNMFENMVNLTYISILFIPAPTLVGATVGTVAGLTYPLSIPLLIYLNRAEKETKEQLKISYREQSGDDCNIH